jgi:deoxyribose-phosphate aldolase
VRERELEALVRSVIERVVNPGSPVPVSNPAPANATAAMRIALGADHGGFPLKEVLKSHLQGKGYAVDDCGTHSTDAVDYPDYAAAVAQRVGSGACRFGIMVDGAGIGSAMAANKVPGVRAALCYDLSTARNAREHNDANVLTLGAGLIGAALAKQIADVFLATDCTEERHRRRVAKIDALAGGPAVQAAPPSTDAPVSATTRESLYPDPAHAPVRFGAETAFRHGSSADSDDRAAAIQPAGRAPETVRSFVAAGASRIGHAPGAPEVPLDIASTIDHTLLKPDATEAQIRTLCEEAARFHFASVCVNPAFVGLCAKLLAGTGVKVCTVIGFPLGATTTPVKAFEARKAIREGAREVDMVLNVGALKSGNYDLVFHDIREVAEATHEGGAILKVILETALLNDEEKVAGCVLSQRARADFVKTSTGFSSGGATLRDVAIMRATVGPDMGVKAAGGIRNYLDAVGMIEAGATRIGASAGVQIVKESRGEAAVSTGGKGNY